MLIVVRLVVRLRVVGWGWSIGWSRVVGWLWMVGWGGVVSRLRNIGGNWSWFVGWFWHIGWDRLWHIGWDRLWNIGGNRSWSIGWNRSWSIGWDRGRSWVIGGFWYIGWDRFMIDWRGVGGRRVGWWRHWGVLSLSPDLLTDCLDWEAVEGGEVLLAVGLSSRQG